MSKEIKLNNFTRERLLALKEQNVSIQVQTNLIINTVLDANDILTEGMSIDISEDFSKITIKDK